MHILLALAITVGLIVLTTVASVLLEMNLVWVLVLATTVWAVNDSHQIELTKYKSGIALRPGWLFLGLLALWIICFPWYLSMRFRIAWGQAVKKEMQEGWVGAIGTAPEPQPGKHCPQCGQSYDWGRVCPECHVPLATSEGENPIEPDVKRDPAVK